MTKKWYFILLLLLIILGGCNSYNASQLTEEELKPIITSNNKDVTAKLE